MFTTMTDCYQSKTMIFSALVLKLALLRASTMYKKNKSKTYLSTRNGAVFPIHLNVNIIHTCCAPPSS